jgi:hypothetical protein
MSTASKPRAPIGIASKSGGLGDPNHREDRDDVEGKGRTERQSHHDRDLEGLHLSLLLLRRYVLG